MKEHKDIRALNSELQNATNDLAITAMRQATDRIEGLKKENEQLRQQLMEIAERAYKAALIYCDAQYEDDELETHWQAYRIKQELDNDR